MARDTDDIRCELRGEQLHALIRALPREFQNVAKRRFRVFGNTLKGELSGELPLGKTGKAQKGVKAPSVNIGLRDVTIKLRPNLKKVPYFNVLERGGTIRPKTAAKLTIPLRGSEAETQGFTARQLKDSPEAYGFDSSFVIRDVIFGRRGNHVQPLFALRSEVLFPRAAAGHYFARFGARQRDRFVREVYEAAVEGAQKALEQGVNVVEMQDAIAE